MPRRRLLDIELDADTSDDGSDWFMADGGSRQRKAKRRFGREVKP